MQSPMPTGFELYTQGNAVFTEGGSCHLEGALALYEKAIVQSSESNADTSAPLQLKLFSNAALCHLALRNYQVELFD